MLREAGAVSINTGLRTATGNVVVGGERDKFLGTMKLKEPRYEAVKMSVTQRTFNEDERCVHAGGSTVSTWADGALYFRPDAVNPDGTTNETTPLAAPAFSDGTVGLLVDIGNGPYGPFIRCQMLGRPRVRAGC